MMDRRAGADTCGKVASQSHALGIGNFPFDRVCFPTEESLLVLQSVQVLLTERVALARSVDDGILCRLGRLLDEASASHLDVR